MAFTFLVLCLAGPSPAAPIHIDVTRRLVINGVDQVEERQFGLTAYQGINLLAKELGPTMRDHGVEWFGFPGVLGWCCPPKPVSSVSEIEAWYRSDAALRVWSRVPGPRYLYGKLLPILRQQGWPAPMMYLLGGPDWLIEGKGRVPKDYAVYGRLMAVYLDLVKQADPRVRWVHLTNEPNAHWYHNHKSGTDYAAMFRTVVTEIKKRHPDVRVGGPVLCWPPTWPPNQKGQSPWYSWDTWSRPLIDTMGPDLDFFDFHHYGLPPDVVLGELELVENYAAATQGRWLPIAVTEMSWKLTDEEWKDPVAHYRKRAWPLMQYFVRIVDHPAKLIINQMHDLHAFSWRVMDSPALEVFWLWRRFRGTRIPATSYGPVRVAAAANGRRVTVMCVNESSSTQPLELRWTGQGQARFVLADRLSLDEKGRRVVKETLRAPPETLPPQSGTSLVYEFPQPVDPPRERRLREVFGDKVLAELPASGKIRVEVSVPNKYLSEWAVRAVRYGIKSQTKGAEVDYGGDILAQQQANAAEARAWASRRVMVGVAGQKVTGPARTYAEVAVKPLKPRRRMTVSLTVPRRDPSQRLWLSFCTLVLEKDVARPSLAAPAREDHS